MNGASIKVYSRAKDGLKQVSENFKVREFACSDGSDAVFISDELVEILQYVRKWAKAPVTINSGYRTATLNKQCGGSTYSQHMYGLAADIKVSGKTPAQVAAYLEAIMPKKGGIGLYKTFTHVDVRADRIRWDSTSGKEIAVSGF